jgi:hypothetical protein
MADFELATSQRCCQDAPRAPLSWKMRSGACRKAREQGTAQLGLYGAPLASACPLEGWTRASGTTRGGARMEASARAAPPFKSVQGLEHPGRRPWLQAKTVRTQS